MKEDISIIDTHVHLWDLKHPELKWAWLEKEVVHPIIGNIDAIKSVGFTLYDLWSEARFSGIGGFVHIQAALGSPDPVAETIWLTELAKTGEAPMKIIGDAGLGHDDSISLIERHMQSPLFVGVRDFNAEPMLASAEINLAYEKSLAFMAKNALVFDLDCEWQNMDQAIKLAERHPELSVVLQHIGFPRLRDDDYFNNWSAAVERLGKVQNVTMKISGLGMTDPRFTKESLRKWVETCLESFGADRCVLGSNWPVDRLYSSYTTIIEFLREYISGLSIAEQEKICNKNATAIYRF
jgi:predicted TIM-barrel fold metal-dependent hydrolase